MSLNWEALQKASQDLESNLKQAHNKMNAVQVTGSAGAGLVHCTMRGDYRISNLTIASESLQSHETPEAQLAFIADLCVAAINDASNRIAEQSKQQMQQLASQFDLSNTEKTPTAAD